MKNKMEIKWTDEELKQLDDAYFDHTGMSYAKFCEAHAENLMKERGCPDFGKLPKYVTRHGKTYQVHKMIDGTNYTFGSYDTVNDAEPMARWVFSHEHPEKLSSKTLKMSQKKYLPYLYDLKELEEKSKNNDSVPIKPVGRRKKILKSLTLPKSSENVLKNLRKEHEIKQNEVVQIALDVLAGLSYEEVEEHLVKRGIH